MMSIFVLIDAAPPVSIGIVLAVLLFIIAAIILMAVGLILFLWYRKRSRRAQNMIRRDDSAMIAAKSCHIDRLPNASAFP